ncbi:acetate--CoA ligase family protein [Methanochimaera problematica]|nr:acetate--CoA ligase family protein [Methanoplanus sp. FWC-SCC4]
MPGRIISEAEGYEILKDAGINVPKFGFAKSEDEAVRAAGYTGYPIVIKISSPDISHKSDVGGVVTGIPDQESLIREYNSLLSRVSEKMPDAQVTGVLIAEQVSPGTELFAGGTIDPSFGRVLSFGTGGTLVELWKDISFRLFPLTPEKISGMIDETRASSVIGGFRGAPPLDREALLDMLGKLGDLFEKRDDIVSFDINPLILTESGVVAVDARFIIDDDVPEPKVEMPEKFCTSEAFLSPKSIAVAGASATPGKIGYFVFQNLLEFEGRLYPVNPKRSEILGVKAYDSVSELPEVPDWLVICVPAKAVPAVLEDAGKSGVRFAVIISAGFRESGEEGRLLEEEILNIARKYDLCFAGPNCLGIMIPGLRLNATFGPKLPQPGPVAFLSQSGAIISAITDSGLVADTGVSAVISLGNQADLKFIDYMRAMERDPQTKAVVLYIEELKNGRKFVESVKKIIKRLPVVAIKAGRSKKGKIAARSHTGSLAGSWEIYHEAFRESGIIPAMSLTEAFETGGLLASEGWPKGNRAVVVSSAGGFAVLSADYAEDYGICLIDLDDDMKEELDSFMPSGWSMKNPIDMIGDAGVERYAKTLDMLIRYQDRWDIAYVAAAPVTSIDPVRLAKETVVFSRQTDKMVVGCLIGGEGMAPGVKVLNDNHIPNFSELESAFRATGLALRAAEEIMSFENAGETK